MSNPVDHPFLSDRLRDWLYPVVTAAVILLGAYGIIAEEQVPLWIGLGAAILGTGTATAYRPKKTVEPLKAREQVAKGVQEAHDRAVNHPDPKRIPGT